MLVCTAAVSAARPRVQVSATLPVLALTLSDHRLTLLAHILLSTAHVMERDTKPDEQVRHVQQVRHEVQGCTSNR